MPDIKEDPEEEDDGIEEVPPPPLVGTIDDDIDDMDEDEDALGTNIRSTERDWRPPQNYQANFSARKYAEERQVYLQCHQGAGYRTKKGIIFVQAKFEEKFDKLPPLSPVSDEGT